MTIYIDKETKKRVNPYAPYKGFTRLETEEQFEKAGVIETPEPTPPEDYISDNYFRTECDSAPYVIYTRKSDEVIAKQDSQKAANTAQAFLDSTDYLFSMDRHEELLSEEPEREVTLKAERATARQIIRIHEESYPNAS